MDALAYGAPQVIVPGRVFERLYNAQSIERAGAGASLESFDAGPLEDACRRVMDDDACSAMAQSLRAELSSLGGAARIVSRIAESLR